MKLVAYLNFISFYIYLTKASSDYANAFIPLIKQVRCYYSSSSVFFLHSYTSNQSDIDAMTLLHIVHTWSLILQRDQIVTQSVTVNNIHVLKQYYDNISRPLIIFFLIGPTSYHEFSHRSKHLKMSAFAWFLIFVPTSESDDMNYCYAPSGNPFHLTFDTEMLVLCLRDTVLREWYSVDGETTTISNLANWKFPEDDSWTTDTELFTNLSLHERRNDLRGIVLRGVTVKNSIFVTRKGDKLKGYFSTVIHELQNSLNFTLDIVAEDLEYGSYNTTTKRWTGAIRYVASGMVDIGVSDFSMTNNRMDYVDYMVPIITTRGCLYLKQPDMFTVKWFAYFRTFSCTIWKSLLATCLLALCVMIFLRSHLESYNMTHLITEEPLRILAIICQQGLIEFPRHSSLRIAYFTMLLTALVISAAYSASLICFLTAYVHDLPFRTIDEFIEDGTYRIIVLKGSADYDMFSNSKDPSSKKIMKLLRPLDDLPLDVESGFKRICNSPKLAYYSGYNLNLQNGVTSIHIPCKVSCLSFGRVNSLSLILSKDNQYTSVLNYHLQKLLNSGLLNRFKNEITYQEGNNFQPVGFGSVASGLLIFACGAALALIFLIIEIYCYKCRDIKDIERRVR